MFVGHFALALAAKRATPRVRLGTLVMAAQWLDLLWPIFLLLGWEQVKPAPGITRFTPFDFVSYPWTHSLLMACVWGAIVRRCFLCGAPRRACRVFAGIAGGEPLGTRLAHAPSRSSFVSGWTQGRAGIMELDHVDLGRRAAAVRGRNLRVFAWDSGERSHWDICILGIDALSHACVCFRPVPGSGADAKADWMDGVVALASSAVGELGGPTSRPDEGELVRVPQRLKPPRSRSGPTRA